ncbi:antibiotic ABC transporter permease [Clostridium polyendosporum]|uniref:Antibiotic ABC transporter permease n=1 Tax=Clostridium polyendosporum TaxID=69208 RepID=A0A919S1A7_9CLOT|nr:ABC-2 family transporter protein [Clostridium polyendosporum]GIM30282.1 antibiotic ABC transporter permease [Clostridium polyendosporum]
MMKRLANTYVPFAKCSLQRFITYRANVFMFILGNIIATFVVYYLWKAIFDNSPEGVMYGFTATEMALYVFMSRITAGLIDNNAVYFVGGEVRDGSIAMSLIKPINFKGRVLFQCLGGTAAFGIFAALPLWIILVVVRYFTIKELPPSIPTLLLYLVSCILAYFVLFFFNYCVGLLAFSFTNLWGISQIQGAVIEFCSGTLIPLVFFPHWFQSALKFVPFSSMNYTPIMIYLGKLKGCELINSLLVQVVWIILLALLSKWMWNRSMKRLTILGG